jgi:hypothetical protein
MDVLVTPASTRGGTWISNDLLGRKLGEIQHAPAEGFFLALVSETALTGVKPGPYQSLDDAMSAIEKHTRGSCRLSGSR